MAGRHEAFLLEMAQCLTHGPPADAEACRQLASPRWSPGRYSPDVIAARNACRVRSRSVLRSRLRQGIHGQQVLLRSGKHNRQLLTVNRRQLTASRATLAGHVDGAQQATPVGQVEVVDRVERDQVGQGSRRWPQFA